MNKKNDKPIKTNKDSFYELLNKSATASDVKEVEKKAKIAETRDEKIEKISEKKFKELDNKLQNVVDQGG